ncbi:ABC transporter ATP-binding protein [Pikeienuella sp. HZG-20]|uniref:ABC transporter ATP-binding protein n=1 Tax=Paludibacillus litoralis TaxID=3133267 RepID=UPI0030EF13A7
MSIRLSVRDLGVAFRGAEGPIQVVHEVSFNISDGETLAVVGESGSGKSVTSLALMRLLPSAPRTILSGEAILRDGEGLDLITLPERRVRRLRGNRIAMIFQEPLTSLNPVYRVGAQIIESIRSHRNVSRAQAFKRALELLEQVGIPEPEKRLQSYPHELSGGMRQRVMIAIALALEPEVLIADEPTTALDVTVQAQILELLREIQDRTGMAMLFITHNFGVVAEIADRTMVMYAGRIVEEGAVAEVLERPLMPYTSGLMRSVPRLASAGRPDVALATIEGFVPDPARMPSGCAFHPRCRHHKPGLCDVGAPELETASGGHRLRCKRWRELGAAP